MILGIIASSLRREIEISLDVLWSPSSISTVLWLDAADVDTITDESSNIIQVADKSGNNYHLTPPGNQPTYTTTGINSMGSLVFGPTQSILQTPSFANPSGVDGLMVAAVLDKTADPVMFPVPICKGAVNAEWSLIWPGASASGAQGQNKSIWRNITGGLDEVRSTTDVGFNTPRVYSGFIANSGIEQFFTGNLEGSTGANTRSFSGPSALSIGGQPSSGNQFQGRIGEIVVVHGDITVSTRHHLEGYLAHKWGLAADLPIDHPYKDSPPTATYSDVIYSLDPVAYWKMDEESGPDVFDSANSGGS